VALTLTGTNIDAADPHALAAFYAALLGWEISRALEDDVWLRPPDGGRGLSFQRERHALIRLDTRSASWRRRQAWTDAGKTVRPSCYRAAPWRSFRHEGSRQPS
jgi:hypothetical protein